MITPQDVVLALSNSGETEEILTILPLIKRLGVPLITLTGNPAQRAAAIVKATTFYDDPSVIAVITSYSIHYTKLYDPAKGSIAPPSGVPTFAARAPLAAPPSPEAATPAPPPSSSWLRPPPKIADQRAIVARIMMAPAMVAAMLPISMSRFFT